MKIVVLAGGYSHERDVSFSSGSQIANALRMSGHRVVMADSYLGMDDKDWPADPDTLFLDGEHGQPYAYTIPAEEPDLAALKQLAGIGDALIGRHVLDLCREADVTFIALHGGMGENGQLQATFDTLGIRYTGSGYVGCMLAMDKQLSKQLMRLAGIDTPDWVSVHSDTPAPLIEEQVRETIGYPCVVKPNGNGSSVGVFMVDEEKELSAAVRSALALDDTVLIEKKIEGREFSVGVLDQSVLPVVEIVPLQGFYDYVNKYQAGRTRDICPAELSDSVASALQKAALQVGRTLRLSNYYRVDFILDGYDRVFCLEANNLPGMTPLSLIPIEAGVAGIEYPDLCDRIVRLAARKID